MLWVMALSAQFALLSIERNERAALVSSSFRNGCVFIIQLISILGVLKLLVIHVRAAKIERFRSAVEELCASFWFFGRSVCRIAVRNSKHALQSNSFDGYLLVSCGLSMCQQLQEVKGCGGSARRILQSSLACTPHPLLHSSQTKINRKQRTTLH